MARVAELIAELEAEGVPVDEGAFSIDRERAVEKLASFRYGERGGYLVPVVEALLGFGARQISVRREGADIIVHADGLVLERPGARLEGAYTSVFGDAAATSDTPLARLAIGLDMALGFDGIERAVVEARASSGGTLAVFEPRTSPRIATLEPRMPGVRVFFDRSRMDDLRASFTNTAPLEFQRLRKALAYGHLPVFVDGERVSFGVPDLAELRTGEGEGFTLVSGFDQSADDPKMLCLHAGVVVDRVPLRSDKWRPGFTVLVEFDEIQRDLSQSKIVRNHTFESAEAMAEWHCDDAPEQRRRPKQAIAGPDEDSNAAPSPPHRPSFILALLGFAFLSPTGLAGYVIGERIQRDVEPGDLASQPLQVFIALIVLFGIPGGALVAANLGPRFARRHPWGSAPFIATAAVWIGTAVALIF